MILVARSITHVPTFLFTPRRRSFRPRQTWHRERPEPCQARARPPASIPPCPSPPIMTLFKDCCHSEKVIFSLLFSNSFSSNSNSFPLNSKISEQQQSGCRGVQRKSEAKNSACGQRVIHRRGTDKWYYEKA